VLGTLNLFLTRTGTLSADDASAAQGLADVAAIGILHERAARQSEVAQEQLQYALNSRVVIEQAKGVIAQTRTVDVDTAFGALRQYARSHNLNLRDVAEQVVARVLVI
jgi:AmiR/NasT family two-component response regulator